MLLFVIIIFAIKGKFLDVWLVVGINLLIIMCTLKAQSKILINPSTLIGQQVQLRAYIFAALACILLIIALVIPIVLDFCCNS